MYYTPKSALVEANQRQMRLNDSDGNTIVSDLNPLDLTSSNQQNLREKDREDE